MNVRALRQNVGFLIVLAVIAAAGTAIAAGVLLNERLPNPFASTYDVHMQLSDADGVVPGYGQPVDVAGVPVGMISKATLSGGVARLTLAIRSGALPHVYRDATASLEPVTPLKDMQIDLDPGSARAGVLGPGAAIGVSATTSPVELEDLLSSLDGDTRSFLSSMIDSLGEGTGGQGPNLRRLLVALGPTGGQLGDVSRALAARRADISALVHNLGILTRAAADNGRLADVLKAGDQTLHAVASQDGALRSAVAQLPSTLGSVQGALDSAAGLARNAQPTLTAIDPVLAQLPATLGRLGPFAGRAAAELSGEIRPLVRTAVPALSQLAPAAKQLSRALPSLKGILQVTNYALNELAYNPGGSGGPGMLFWLDWAAHNVNSAAGNEDAHGAIARTLVFASCQELTDSANIGAAIEDLLNINEICKS